MESFLAFVLIGAVMAFRFRRRFRALRRSARPKAVVVRREARVEEDLQPWAPRVPNPSNAQIRIVEVKELRGNAWVIDGDTIDIAGTRIRLAGIDAPELDHPYGPKAKWALVRLCKGQVVRAVFDGEMSHERTVATCYLADGRDLSAEMVKAGLAIDWPKFSRGKYSGLELPNIRKKLWRCDARQKGRMPPVIPD
jgi:micrococcal nuclease